MAGTLELYPPTYTNKHHNSGDPPQQYHNTTVTIQSNSLSLMLFTRARAFQNEDLVETETDDGWTVVEVVPFLIIYDKGYRSRLAAWKNASNVSFSRIG